MERNEEQNEQQTVFSHEKLLSCLKNDGINLTEDQCEQMKHDQGEIYYDIGNKYYRKNNHKALAWYGLADAKNHSQAQFQIGWMYYFGEGVTEDDQHAMEWFLKSAHNDGNRQAQFCIGMMYRKGHAVDKNIKTAIEWYSKAANQEYKSAQFWLGRIYEYDNEVKDLQKAIDWYKKAYDNGRDCLDAIQRLNKQRYFYKGEETGKVNFRLKQ